MMRPLSQLNKNKRAVSDVVAYALLISMTLVLSLFVGNWLRFYAGEGGGQLECHENTEVSVDSYNCTSGSKGEVTAFFKNTGLFKVDGILVRVTEDPQARFADLGNWNLGGSLKPGEAKNGSLYFELDGLERFIEEVTLIEVQPYILDEHGKEILCPHITRQKIECSPGWPT